MTLQANDQTKLKAQDRRGSTCPCQMVSFSPRLANDPRWPRRRSGIWQNLTDSSSLQFKNLRGDKNIDQPHKRSHSFHCHIFNCRAYEDEEAEIEDMIDHILENPEMLYDDTDSEMVKRDNVGQDTFFAGRGKRESAHEVRFLTLGGLLGPKNVMSPYSLWSSRIFGPISPIRNRPLPPVQLSGGIGKAQKVF